MTRQYEDRFAEYEELLFRVREAEGDSPSFDTTCPPSDSLVPSSVPSDSLSAESSPLDACEDAIPPRVSPAPTTRNSAPSGTGRWRRMLKHFGKLVLP